MSSSFPRRVTAAILAVGLFGLAPSVTVRAGSLASLSGRVLGDNGADPRAGVVVALVDASGEQVYRSAATDVRGGFTIGSAPAGAYALLVEAPEGAFLAAGNLQLAPGVNRPVSLALKPGKQEAPPEPPPASAAPKGGVPTWAKWVIAGGIVVGAAIVVDAVTSDDEEASTF